MFLGCYNMIGYNSPATIGVANGWLKINKPIESYSDQELMEELERRKKNNG